MNGRQARELADTWLAHLRRDSRGLPVPWINRWGEESIDASSVRFCPYAGQRALFHDDHGDVPDYTKQNMARQRRAVAEGLCQVCGRAVPWSRRYLVLSSVTTEHVDVTGVGVVLAVSEPWLDQRCAVLATTMCPALIRRKADEDLRLIAITAKRQAQQILSVGALDEEAFLRAAGGAFTAEQEQAARRLRDEAGPDPVGMWIKIALRAPTTAAGPAFIGGARS